AGNNPVIPESLFGSFRTMTANVVLEMGYAGELQLGALIATGCVLFFFVLVINLLFGLIRDGGVKTKMKRKGEKVVCFGGAKTIIIGKGEKADGKIKLLTANVDDKIKLFTANVKSLFNHRSKLLTNVKSVMCYVCAAVGVAALVTIIVFVFVKGAPHISLDLLTKNFDYGESPTIMPSIVVTIMLVALSLTIAIPLGLCTAIFLSEYTKKNSKFVKIIRGAIELLAGIPSIVYGLFGMVFFCVLLKLGTSVLAGSLTVAIMIIPIICRSTEESLKAVPQCYREGSYALGAGKARTIFKVVLPSAIPGILAAVILAIGRVISESAPLMFTMGASLKGLPQKGFLSSGTSLSVALYVLAGEGLYIDEAYATACILILIVLALNLISTFLVTKLQKKFVGAK
ncbi:MAG: phosphate ABC transporter permease PstA, partial [Clostridia bacterium]